MSQTKKAVTKSASMPAEMSLVDRVLTTLISCGSNEIVVSVAPINPRVITKSILPFFLGEDIFTSFLIWRALIIRRRRYNETQVVGFVP